MKKHTTIGVDPNFTNNDIGLPGGQYTATTSYTKPNIVSEVRDLRIKLIRLEMENKYLKDTIEYLINEK